MTVTLCPEAALDIADAAQWYEDRTAGLGVAFVTEVDQAILRAENAPKLYALVYQQLRRVHVRRFPYSIYFISNRTGLQIVAVLHHRRDPQIWQDRTR